MAAKDLYHDHVRKALETDGWTITHDPLSVKWLGRSLQIDLGAERIIAAEKGNERIAVEVKSFIGDSPIEDLRDALGQFVIYRSALRAGQPERKLYLAIRADVYVNIFEKPEGETLRTEEEIRIIVSMPRNKRWSNGSIESIPRNHRADSDRDCRRDRTMFRRRSESAG